MIKKMNRLKCDLKSKETKLKALNERFKDDKKMFKKKLKERKKTECKRKDNIEFLEYKIEEMRLNEEQLIDDLYHQQSLAKDAIRSMENLANQFDEERERIRKDVENQLQTCMDKESKAWAYQMDALRTVNDSLTKRIQRYEEQESNLIESERRNEQLEQQLEEFTEDLERVRNERKAFKEENHKLMKKVIQIEEAFKVKERDYEHKLKKINFKLQEFQKLNDTTLIEEKLKDKSNQVKLLVGKVKSIEDETQRISKRYL